MGILDLDVSLWPLGSLWIQLINFLVLLFILNFIVYKPIRKILGRRREEMDSLALMISDFEDNAARHEKDLVEGLKLARKDGFKEREDLKGSGLEEEKGLLQEATSTVDGRIAEAREEIAKMVSDARWSLEEQIGVFAQELAEKILGRSV